MSASCFSVSYHVLSWIQLGICGINEAVVATTKGRPLSRTLMTPLKLVRPPVRTIAQQQKNLNEKKNVRPQHGVATWAQGTTIN